MTRFWDGLTDRRMDGQTDGQTDGVTALLDLLSPLATQVKIPIRNIIIRKEVSIFYPPPRKKLIKTRII